MFHEIIDCFFHLKGMLLMGFLCCANSNFFFKALDFTISCSLLSKIWSMSDTFSQVERPEKFCALNELAPLRSFRLSPLAITVPCAGAFCIPMFNSLHPFNIDSTTLDNISLIWWTFSIIMGSMSCCCPGFPLLHWVGLLVFGRLCWITLPGHWIIPEGWGCILCILWWVSFVCCLSPCLHCWCVKQIWVNWLMSVNHPFLCPFMQMSGHIPLIAMPALNGSNIITISGWNLHC